MIYHAVDNRCAFDPLLLSAVEPDLLFPELSSESLTLVVKRFFMEEYGIQVVKVDMIAIAREWLGRSIYKVRAKFSEAPKVVDCSSFVKWVYARRGIWLPRLSIQQSVFGKTLKRDISSADLLPCDLIFTGGPWYVDDPLEGIGHVGIVTSDQMVIHAIGRVGSVTESPLEEFLGEQFRGASRLIPERQEILTLEIPSEMEVETSDDLAWLIARDFRSWLARKGKSLEVPW